MRSPSFDEWLVQVSYETYRLLKFELSGNAGRFLFLNCASWTVKSAEEFEAIMIIVGDTLSQNASNYLLDATEVVPVKRFCIVGEQKLAIGRHLSLNRRTFRISSNGKRCMLWPIDRACQEKPGFVR
jgi:hypothetical protein